MATERRDPEWARVSEDSLNSLLTRLLYPNLGAGFKATCAATICRIDGQLTSSERELWQSQARDAHFKIYLSEYDLEYVAGEADLNAGSTAFRTYVRRVANQM
ncbi:hypothetical protein DMC47_16965 [Nostoc sp. 3335mG]|nr:hypothetical protein DMC47_16965 [Nostoc sp. 3335mG]